MRRNCRGVTLLELLVAVAVFAVLAVLAYGGLDAVLNTSRAARDEMTQLAELQRAMTRISADIEQMAAREVRDNYGDTLEAVVVEQIEPQAVRIEFTRRGNQNLTGQPRSNLQRVAYSLQDGKLLRESWSVLDRAQDSQPYQAEILNDVTAFSVVLVVEQDDTRPAATATQVAQPLPRAVEISLQHKKWGSLRRLLRVAG